MAKTAEELLQMKSQMDRADKQKSELQGQIKEILSRLKKEFNCSSLQQGDDKLEKMKATLDRKQKRLDKGVAELKEKMEEVDGNNL